MTNNFVVCPDGLCGMQLKSSARDFTLNVSMFIFNARSSRKGLINMNNDLVLVQDLIHEIRGKKVMLDYDLAKLYQIETRSLKQAVRRNLERFPPDFMFPLSDDEYNSLKINMRSQIVISKERRNDYTRYAPFAFTQEGVAMLSSVLRSDVAIAANIQIMRAFVRVREYLQTASTISTEVKELKARVNLIEIQQEENLEAINDLSEDVRRDIDSLCIALSQLTEQHEDKKKPVSRIGFKQKHDKQDS